MNWIQVQGHCLAQKFVTQFFLHDSKLAQSSKRKYVYNIYFE